MRSKRYSKASKGKSETFKLRRNQLFGPYGIGAIMPCPGGESLMISGLDAFPTQTMQTVDDQRLAKHIGVSKLLSPPEDSPVPASRFPRWLYCPTCHTMRECKPNQAGPGKCTNPSCKDNGRRDLIPERFIVICPKGHVDDLPILEWVHRGPVSNRDAHMIKRTTKGGTANLSDIEYKCVTCGVSRSLAGITNKGALAEVGYKCSGSQPWLWRKDPDGCNSEPEDVMVVQRGGTNVWYPDVFCSIYIPDGKDPRKVSFVQDNLEMLAEAEQSGALDFAIAALSSGRNYDKDVIRAIYRDLASGNNSGSSTEGDFKQQEYRTLSLGSLKQKGVFEEEIVGVERYDSANIREAIECVGLVSTLRETRALIGFSRLYPDHNDGLSFEARKKQLSVRDLDWTLGIQSTGEGIFLKFNKAVLEEWSKQPKVLSRFSLMQTHHDEHCSRQGREKEVLNPLYVLIHSFSHALMLSLSKECGYSAASVRERIYCDKLIKKDDRHEDMLGLLIYTASSDSEGSLGGLVRAGRPGRLEHIIDSAISAATWCSSDPVCIESRGQGPESCNLAACYSCALVPETSCENSNKLLDRALLIGTLTDKTVGLFSTNGPQNLSNDSSKTEVFDAHKTCANTPGAEPVAVEKLSHQITTLSPLSNEGYDMSHEGFASACEHAIQEVETDTEAAFIEQFIQIGITLELDTPMFLVPFLSNDGIQIDSALAWMDSKVALFVGEQAEELVDYAGRISSTDEGWTLYTVCDSLSPSDLARKVVGE